MSALIHKLGLELDLTSAKAPLPDHKDRIEAKMQGNDGIIHAGFSRDHPDVVVIEYDPCITSPDEICSKVKRLNGSINKKVFL